MCECIDDKLVVGNGEETRDEMETKAETVMCVCDNGLVIPVYGEWVILRLWLSFVSLVMFAASVRQIIIKCGVFICIFLFRFRFLLVYTATMSHRPINFSFDYFSCDKITSTDAVNNNNNNIENGEEEKGKEEEEEERTRRDHSSLTFFHHKWWTMMLCVPFCRAVIEQRFTATVSLNIFTVFGYAFGGWVLNVYSVDSLSLKICCSLHRKRITNATSRHSVYASVCVCGATPEPNVVVFNRVGNSNAFYMVPSSLFIRFASFALAQSSKNGGERQRKRLRRALYDTRVMNFNYLSRGITTVFFVSAVMMTVSSMAFQTDEVFEFLSLIRSGASLFPCLYTFLHTPSASLSRTFAATFCFGIYDIRRCTLYTFNTCNTSMSRK